MSFEALRHEYRTQTIGPLILGVVTGVVEATARRYDPRIYAGTASWQEGLEDLVQEVVVRVLLEERQLEYLMLTSRSLRDFRALLRRQVERQLARRRQRTVIDNLLDRCRQLLEASERFTRHGRGSGTRYALAGRSVERRNPTTAELRAVAIRVRVVPKTPYLRGERAPQVYSTSNLEAVLELIALSLPTWFQFRDLDSIFKDVLTGWIPSFLDTDAVVRHQADPDLSPEDDLMTRTLTRELFDALGSEQRLILLRKAEGAADAALAKELGVSRPTAAMRKDKTLGVVERVLGPAPQQLQDEIIGRVVALCALEVAGGYT